MVTSLWHHRGLHPRGLVPNSKGPLCHFRGDWSQRIASLTSESDSNTFAESHLSYYSFSLTTDIFRVSKNPRVPAVQRVEYRGYGVRVHSIIRFWLFVNFPFVTRQWLLWRKVINCRCGNSFVYKYLVRWICKDQIETPALAADT